MIADDDRGQLEVYAQSKAAAGDAALPNNQVWPAMSEPRDTHPDPRVLDIYKLAVEMADRVSARRVGANAFFLTVNTTLVAVVGLSEAPDSTARFSAVCLAGVAVSVCWWLLLRVYRRLDSAKFAVINQIEARYLLVKLYTDEWAELMPGDTATTRRARLGKVFRELGGVERIVPVVFGLLYVILLVGRLVT